MAEMPDPVGVSPMLLEHMFDTIEAQLKSGRAGVGAPVSSRPNHQKGVAMSSVPNKSTTRQQIAEEYLKLSREHVERSKKLRLHFAKLAADEGMSYEAIGRHLGITGAAVRLMIARAE